MYKYLSEVEILINEMAKTYEIKEKSLAFYKGRINNFFSGYMGLLGNENRPLNALTYFDIDSFLSSLKCSDAEKANYYSALKRFFQYTYLKSRTNEIISQVTKPVYIRKRKEILSEDEYIKLKKFIVDRDNNLKERLTLGLFIFTGLSRKYIASLRKNDFIYEEGIYKIVVWNNENEVKLPLKAELQLLIHEYCTSFKDSDKLEKVVEKDENSISTYVGDLTKKVVGKRFTPTILSNTFISKALSNGNYIWEVCTLTLESVSTIKEHLSDFDNLTNRQTAVLNSF